MNNRFSLIEAKLVPLRLTDIKIIEDRLKSIGEKIPADAQRAKDLFMALRVLHSFHYVSYQPEFQRLVENEKALILTCNALGEALEEDISLSKTLVDSKLFELNDITITPFIKSCKNLVESEGCFSFSQIVASIHELLDSYSVANDEMAKMINQIREVIEMIRANVMVIATANERLNQAILQFALVPNQLQEAFQLIKAREVEMSIGVRAVMSPSPTPLSAVVPGFVRSYLSKSSSSVTKASTSSEFDPSVDQTDASRPS